METRWREYCRADSGPPESSAERKAGRVRYYAFLDGEPGERRFKREDLDRLLKPGEACSEAPERPWRSPLDRGRGCASEAACDRWRVHLTEPPKTWTDRPRLSGAGPTG